VTKEVKVGPGMAHFALGIAQTSTVVTHRTVQETWFVAAIGVTMPPWPGEGGAVAVIGPWTPTEP